MLIAYLNNNNRVRLKMSIDEWNEASGIAYHSSTKWMRATRVDPDGTLVECVIDYQEIYLLDIIEEE